MPSSPIKSKTGKADIKGQGHTTSRQHGSNPNAQVLGRKPAQPLKAK